MRDARSLDRVVGAIADKHQRLDGVIAAAGVQQLKSAVDYTIDEVRDMMDVNYSGVFMTCASAARAMFKWNPGRRDGSMVIIASMSGSVANKGLICPVYNSSKAALLQLTRNLAMEWSAKGKENANGLGGIRVNSLSPGHILTVSRSHFTANTAELTLSSSRWSSATSKRCPAFVRSGSART